ncbi:hypothetical protein HanRHA438_Chr05g0202651 [Helianthus annuus]|nr:hypothetical protein HanRHA438_Chr05g0202651 [Helianthus annuus]
MSELTSGFTPFPFRVIAYVRPLVFPIFTRAFIQEILIRNHCELMRTMLRKEITLMPRYTYRR